MFTKFEKFEDKLLKKLPIRKAFLQKVLYGLLALLMLTVLIIAYDWTKISGEMEAYRWAQNHLSDPNYSCLDHFDGEGKIDGYMIFVTEENGLRSATLTWKTFFLFPDSATFTLSIAPGCLFD